MAGSVSGFIKYYGYVFTKKRITLFSYPSIKDEAMDERGKVYFVACVNDSQCGDNAFCTAIGQNHTCLCNSGFQGNGLVCYGMETRLRPR